MHDHMTVRVPIATLWYTVQLKYVTKLEGYILWQAHSSNIIGRYMETTSLTCFFLSLCSMYCSSRSEDISCLIHFVSYAWTVCYRKNSFWSNIQPDILWTTNLQHGDDWFSISRYIIVSEYYKFLYKILVGPLVL